MTLTGGNLTFDIAFIGHYTRDTIVYPHATRTVDGGGYFFGANVATQMGLRVAVITRLAAEDWGAVAKLEQLGVTMLAHPTPTSTVLRLIYPTANLDQRTIELSSWAGPFDLADVADVPARAYAIAAWSVRGEISLEVIEALAAHGGHIALDVQGFIPCCAMACWGTMPGRGKRRCCATSPSSRPMPSRPSC